MTICVNDNCKKNASFNDPGKKAKYCKDHKTENMVDVLNKICHCGLAQPRWNYVGLQPEYCVSCKLPDMIEPHRKKCFCGKVRPSFNLQGFKPEFCNACKSDNMINVLDKRCTCGKTTSPLYNFEGQKPQYCVDCKMDGMIDVKNLKCACGNRPSFNYEGLKGRYCTKCRLKGMIDVAHNRCFCGENQPNFNYKGLTAAFCSKCKNDDMEDLKHSLCFCEKAIPIFNLQGLSPKYCASCKTEEMVDVHHKKCKTLYCEVRVENKYEGYCLRCFIYTFPENTIVRNYKTKETFVAQYVLSAFPNFTWITDKKIQDGCSRKRPDLFLDLGYQVIIVEIDENQHKSYDCSCQNKRIMELSQDVQHRPIIFIRFNPDAYNMNNMRISSCWMINTKGICEIRTSKKNEWNNRLDALRQQINYWSNPENKTDKMVETIQLYYDQNV